MLTAFGLQDQEAALARAFRVTGAAIHGGAALSWYLNTDPPAGQDIDIWCQPSERILSPLIHALYDTIFRAAGYAPEKPTTDKASYQYYGLRELHIDAIHNWFNPTVNRKIQLILRSSTAPSADPTTEFDLDITTVKVAPVRMNGADRLLVTVPTTELAVQIRRRVMSIANLRGQILSNNLRRVYKYYSRGFAFEVTEATCACACGAVHHTAVTPPRRLTLSEAFAHVRKAWVAANPLPDWYALRADVLKRHITTHFAGKTLLTANRATLADLRESCIRATGLYQNAVVYPAETAWLMTYRKAINGLWTLRNIQHWTSDSYRGVINMDRYVTQLKSLETNPIMDMFPSLRTELEELQVRVLGSSRTADTATEPRRVCKVVIKRFNKAPEQEINVCEETKKPTVSPSLMKVVTEDDTITHV